MLASLTRAYAASGMKSDAMAGVNRLSEMSKTSYVSAYTLAVAYAGIGDKDRAFEWLERAYDERASWLIFLKVEPVFNSLRSDARFDPLLHRIGLS
ncbi:MAG TPA: hypothetical protein VKM94_20720 [Blastocatellia bacterium]|nr:hypothetical protein [Blastocatellia bacterium]